MNRTPAELAAIANQTADALHILAQAAAAQYSEECADTSNTNPAPTTDAERFAALLHTAALAINASGLCDREPFRVFINYSHWTDARRPALAY